MTNIQALRKFNQAQDTSSKVIEFLKEFNDGDICDFEYHRSVIETYILRNKTIPAILPSFPGKPINPNLAPSHIPDGAEEYAISKLKEMIAGVEKIYAPGINIKLFHDGYYFIHLAMDYDYYRMQEYVDTIKLLCKDSNITSIDLKNVTEGSTFEARMNYWNCLYYPTEEEINTYNMLYPEVYSGMVAFFYNHFSRYLYPHKSNLFRRKVSKYIAWNYVVVNMSVQNYIKDHFKDDLRLSVKKQDNITSQKFYVDILQGIENHGLPWMNTLIEENGRKVIKKFRD